MSNSPRAASAFFQELIGNHKGRVATLSASSLIGALMEAAFLVLVTGIAMALVAGSRHVGPVLGQTLSVNAALLSAGLTLAVRLAFSLLSVATSSRLTAEVTRAQRERLSHSFLNASWPAQQAEQSGRLQELLTSFVTRVTQSVQMLSNAITALLSLIAFLVTALLVDVRSTGALLLALVLVGAALTPLRRRIRQRAQSSSRTNLEFANAVAEYGSLGLEMQTYGVRDHFISAIDGLTEETARKQERVQRLVSALAPVYMTFAYFAVLVGVSLLAWLGFDDLDVIGAVMLLMLRSLSYGQQLASASGTLSANRPFLEQIGETARSYAVQRARNGKTVPSATSPIVFSDVSFSYTKERRTISGANLALVDGEALGVIGPSGSGKSTFAQLLLGLREPTHGVISVASVDLTQIDRSWWNRNVAFVAQEARLFTGTVAENIRFFRPEIDDETLREAARRAHVLDDINAMPSGFQTQVGAQGSGLSGGQRQRISLARALAGSPDVLVLDEPTSALDNQSESAIRATLAELRGEVLLVIIAHRITTLEMCDRIAVIESGEITALGTAAQLLAQSEFYRQSLLGPRASDHE